MIRRMTGSLRFAPLLATLSLALAASGCPKDDAGTGTTPVPSPTAPDSTPTPGSIPGPTGTPPDAADGREWSVSYRWSGGLSIYNYYELDIRGADGAEVVFKVKPLKHDEVTVEDTLDPDEFAELKGLFAAADFDKVTVEPRKVRVMDIGQTVIRREIAGEEAHEVTENPAQRASGDIQALRKWFDTRVRAYLDEAGVSPKKRAPAASPTVTP